MSTREALKIPQGRATEEQLWQLWQLLASHLLSEFAEGKRPSAAVCSVARKWLRDNEACFDQVHKVPALVGLRTLAGMTLPFPTKKTTKQ